ncbi:NHL repeat-containing protein [Paenibacillus sp. UNCCL117]|uniref:NHL repeat-containing protein n=1 Tax=unclassified Paenibacillus TaxID=185978 RepID=UPI000887A9F7|nr:MULTISPECIES: NHL repeat-containing protein [unclassified Paenibacillus]SDE26090.1 NHL repeat-containing protein [Paenibacillus sp. cl123]SFW62552.1 NHL repeat-containing protein [Paenibacillus sp. UNCCL117]
MKGLMPLSFIRIVVLTFVLALIVPIENGAYAKSPYEGYGYSYWGKTIPAPVAYKPGRTVSGGSLGIGHFNQPRDLFVARDGSIYVVDTGNARIVVLNAAFEFVREITGFDNRRKADNFNSPNGIFVTDDNDMYIADTGNSRVVHLDAAGKLAGLIETPKSEVLTAGFVFLPIKVAVDKAKRVYVVAQGTFDGIMEFDADGRFTGFTGTNRVRFSMVDYFWKMIATQEQRDRMQLFIPTEYTNLDIDPNGFLYTTNSDANTASPIKRLNPTGIDVLRKEGYAVPSGDLKYIRFGEASGPSLFTDIAVRDNGVYSALDVRRGKIFTYDWDGNLLYIFGKLGNQKGTFHTPAAIDYAGDSILVLDRALNRITVFETTPIGRLINQAVDLHFKGKDEQSAELWNKVIEYDANYDIAYTGISKAKLRSGMNRQAAEYAGLGMDKGYYSKAFQRYRKDVMREYFGTAMSLAFVLALGVLVLRAIRRKKGGERRA